MKIILNSCTFSNDITIGKASFDYDKDIDNLFVNGYSLQPTDNIKNALSDFVTKLKNTNFWDKIQGIYIPLLGTTANDSFLNVRKSLGTDNVIDSYPSGAFEMDSENKGVKGTSQNLYGPNWPKNWYSDDCDLSDFHMCIVSKEYKPTKDDAHCFLGNFKISKYNQSFIDNVCKVSYLNTILLNETQIPVNIEKPTILCYNKDSDTIFSNTKFSTVEHVKDTEGAIKYYPFYKSIYKDIAETQNLFGVKYYSYGKKMTEQEMKMYYNIVDNLVTSLLAEV